MNGSLNDHVSKASLSQWMQMNLRLFKNYRRTFRHILKKSYNREDLGDTKTHVSQ